MLLFLLVDLTQDGGLYRAIGRKKLLDRSRLELHDCFANKRVRDAGSAVERSVRFR